MGRPKAVAWAAAALASAGVLAWSLSPRGAPVAPDAGESATGDPASGRLPRGPNAPDGSGGGGLFEQWVGDAEPAASGALAARLFSPRAPSDECLELCPPELHVVGGDRGRRTSAAVLAAISGAVERLAAEPGLDGEVGAALLGTLHALESSVARPSPSRALRALFVRGTEGVPPGVRLATGLCVSDLDDPWFDRRRAKRGGGARILVNRLDGERTADGGPRRLLGGLLEFAGDGAGGAPAPPTDAHLASLRASIGLHYRDEAVPTVGLGLDLDGTLFTYGYFGEGIRRLRPDPALRVAIEGVLRAV